MHANCLRDWKRLSKLQPMRLIPIFRVDQRRKAQQVLLNRNEEHAVRNSNVISTAGRGRRAIRARPGTCPYQSSHESATLHYARRVV